MRVGEFRCIPMLTMWTPHLSADRAATERRLANRPRLLAVFRAVWPPLAIASVGGMLVAPFVVVGTLAMIVSSILHESVGYGSAVAALVAIGIGACGAGAYLSHGVVRYLRLRIVYVEGLAFGLGLLFAGAVILLMTLEGAFPMPTGAGP
jgi:hypothetical protein